MTSAPMRLLEEWFSSRISGGALGWLQDKAQALASGASENIFFTAFSSASRQTGKSPLELSDIELMRAGHITPGWDPSEWTCDQAARTYLILSLPEEIAVRTLERTFATADLGESQALCQSLFLRPNPAAYMELARQGMRSNITLVFRSISLNNPYPALYFDELAWNQMVLKALFVGMPLRRIQDLDTRGNPTLKQMLIDLARERRKAGRIVSPELWRCVGPFATLGDLQDLEDALTLGDGLEKQGAALALFGCPLPEARDVLNRHPVLAGQVRMGSIAWENLAYDEYT